MSLTAKEAFKIGFLLRCADENLTDRETDERLEKIGELFEKNSNAVFDILGRMAALGIIVPVVGGIGTGYVLSKVTDKEIDPEDVKKKELISEYKRLARQAKRQSGLKIVGQSSFA